MENVQVRKTADGSLTLFNHTYEEDYHSRVGAALEADELYLSRSGFKEFISTGKDCSVLDVGLGLGYNAITTIDYWMKQQVKVGHLSVISLEKSFDLLNNLLTGEASWMQGWNGDWKTLASSPKPFENGFRLQLHHPTNQDKNLDWQIIACDASSWQPAETFYKRFDFCWQDPFSPKKNPEMWNHTWFKKLHWMLKNSGVMVTYSVARSVRDSLEASHWSVKKVKSGVGKRHWLQATPAP